MCVAVDVDVRGGGGGKDKRGETEFNGSKKREMSSRFQPGIYSRPSVRSVVSFIHSLISMFNTATCKCNAC